MKDLNDQAARDKSATLIHYLADARCLWMATTDEPTQELAHIYMVEVETTC
jgi:hypothetical protein